MSNPARARLIAADSGSWRVTLRPTRPDDAEAVSIWLAEAVAAVDGRPSVQSAAPTLTDFLGDLSQGQEALAVADARDVPVGLVVLSRRGEGVSTVDWLAIEAARRNLGFGAQAIFALEERVSNDTLIGRIPATNGLAIYFWLRAGYRPMYPAPPGKASSTEFVWVIREAFAKGQV